MGATAPHSQAVPYLACVPSRVVSRSLFENSPPPRPGCHTSDAHSSPRPSAFVSHLNPKETLLERVGAGTPHRLICTPTVLEDTLTNKRL